MDREEKAALWNRAYGRFLPMLMHKIMEGR